MILCRSVALWFTTIVLMSYTYFMIIIASPFLKVFGINDGTIIYTVTKLLLCLGRIKVAIQGFENITADRSCIILSNHTSMLDVFILQRIITKKLNMTWLAKKSLFSIPILGRILKKTGGIPLDRSSIKESYKSIYAMMEMMKRNHTALTIFPEGTRSYSSGQLRPFKKGAFIVALRMNIPIQPISIKGIHKLMPMQKGKWIQRIYPGEINVKIHPPIETGDYENKTAKELSEYVRGIIAAPLAEN